MFRYEMHLHTRETSPCGKVKGKEIVRLYKEKGYDGIVVTDHYNLMFFGSFSKMKWSDKVDMYLKGYRNALNEGRKLGMSVLLGMEIRLRFNFNEYLVYGFDEEFLFNNPKLYHMSLRKLSALVKKHNFVIYQAHPYRIGMTRCKREYIDGIEVYNGNPRHNSRNDKAKEYAKVHNLKTISGSDFHRIEDAGRGGVILPYNPNNGAELAKILRESKKVKLIET